MKANNTYNVVIANEAYNFTTTKYNTTLTGFTYEAANNAAREALRDIAGELGYFNYKVIYSPTLDAWTLTNKKTQVIIITAKIEETTDTMNTNTKTLTVKRSEWNETAKRLECAGWYYIGAPTATGKTIYRRDNSEIEIIIEEDTTPATMNEAITNELNARNDKSAWDKAVTTYALELVESLDNWEKQPASVAELRKMLLNGADDWAAYSWGGSSLIYNGDIAERCCTASELKRVTRKDGSLRDMANAREHWLDVQARALYQAANRVAEIAAKYFNA